MLLFADQIIHSTTKYHIAHFPPAIRSKNLAFCYRFIVSRSVERGATVQNKISGRMSLSERRSLEQSEAYRLTGDDIDRIVKAVEKRFDEEVAFPSDLVGAASLRGNETGVRELVAQALEKRGFDIHRFAIDTSLIGKDAAFSPSTFDLKDSHVVVKERGCQSWALAGTERAYRRGACWFFRPLEVRAFQGNARRGLALRTRRRRHEVALAANLFALDALSDASFDLTADVQFQSVNEEETTGNGAAIVLARGFTADAVLIPEPTGEKLVSANTGVMKFAVTVKGVPAHPFEAASGRSAIDICHPHHRASEKP
ncbi:hypothetical protein [Sinorhizobium chiapasense]|uniref:Uncharacterized protein n=1 Tax=Sinorhizobium chiapasense TaxID=501572 RepID=A0ABZ2BIF3_9HYPH